MRPPDSAPIQKPNIIFSGGGLRRPKSATPKPRLTTAQREASTEQVRLAREQAIAGDDAALRTLTDVRYAVECVVDAGEPFGGQLPNGQYSRRRKFSNPLFLTPAGLIEAYPEKDEDLFTLQEQSLAAVHALGRGGEWAIRETLLSMEMSNKQYVRWLAEVKGKTYIEAKRSIEELAEIYRQGGRLALRSLYTREHVAKIVTRLRKLGVAVQE